MGIEPSSFTLDVPIFATMFLGQRQLYSGLSLHDPCLILPKPITRYAWEEVEPTSIYEWRSSWSLAEYTAVKGISRTAHGRPAHSAMKLTYMGYSTPYDQRSVCYRSSGLELPYA